MSVINNDLRLKIAELVMRGGGGHIPSSYSVLDIIESVYSKFVCNPSSKFKSTFTLSKGHGLPFTVGRALGSLIKGKNDKFFVLVGDGECHEGTIWESAIVANNLKLRNLILLVDYNKSSDQICPHNSLVKQFESFGWYTISSDGHLQNDINCALDLAISDDSNSPKAIIFNTIKGKGVSFMEGHGPWHYKIPNQDEYKLIKQELLG